MQPLRQLTERISAFDRLKSRMRNPLVAGQPAKYKPQVLRQGTREHRPAEELLGLAIVFRCFARDYLLQGDGKLVGIERAAFADFRARRCDLVSGFHQRFLRRRASFGNSFRTSLRSRRAMATARRESVNEISPCPG
jgi:hypothetical protein